MTVKHLFLEYNKLNQRGTFSPGDTLSGRVTVVTTKEIKVQCFVVKAKGKEPQYGTRISFYGSGKVTMNVTSEKMGLKQGEAMVVTAEIINDSARTVTPKFYLCEKQTFVTQSKRITHINDILFGTGDPVSAKTSQTISKALMIPPQLHPTFFNCSMMKLEYRVKVVFHVVTNI
ncbi:hypothetical protein LDENG_00268720 [Lucifuga dentata]|nr:hypothetical protein LDENG_00268720 [Lucifuga dentata]